MKKIIPIALISIFSLFSLVGCVGDEISPQQSSSSNVFIGESSITEESTKSTRSTKTETSKTTSVDPFADLVTLTMGERITLHEGDTREFKFQCVKDEKYTMRKDSSSSAGEISLYKADGTVLLGYENRLVNSSISSSANGPFEFYSASTIWIKIVMKQTRNSPTFYVYNY